MMEQLVVLGIIPGTNIQIGLAGWLSLFTVAAVTTYIVRRERREQTLRFALIHISLLIATRRKFQRV